jgi:hypothetical protein
MQAVGGKTDFAELRQRDRLTNRAGGQMRFSRFAREPRTGLFQRSLLFGSEAHS